MPKHSPPKTHNKIITLTVIILILFLTLVITPTHAQNPNTNTSIKLSQEPSITIYLMFDSEESMTIAKTITQLTPQTNISIQYKFIDFNNATNVPLYNTNGIHGVIIISKTGMLDPQLIDLLPETAINPLNFILAISTAFELFPYPVLNILGITGTNHTYPQQQEATWLVETTNIEQKEQFQMNATIQPIHTVPGSITLIQAINTTNYPESEEKPQIFPIPLLINTTQPKTAKTYVSGAITSSLTENEEYENEYNYKTANKIRQENQDPQTKQTIQDYIKFLYIAYTTIITTTINQIISSNAQTQQNNATGITLPQIMTPPALITLLLILLLAIIAKITNFFQWLHKKIRIVLTIIIGAVSQKYYFHKERVLEETHVITNPLRQQIITILEQKKFLGAHVRELKEKTNTGVGALLWHLQVLEDFRYIKRKIVDGYVVFVLKEYEKQFDEKIKQAELLLKTKNGKQILQALISAPQKEWTISELSRTSQVNRKTTRNILRKLVALGIAKPIENKTKDNKNQLTKYALTPEGIQTLESIYKIITEAQKTKTITNPINIQPLNK